MFDDNAKNPRGEPEIISPPRVGLRDDRHLRKDGEDERPEKNGAVPDTVKQPGYVREVGVWIAGEAARGKREEKSDGEGGADGEGAHVEKDSNTAC